LLSDGRGWLQSVIVREARQSVSETVGWVERSDTHQWAAQKVMGFAPLYPSYGYP